MSLFDSTGKNAARARGSRTFGVTFVSMTVPFDICEIRGGERAGGNHDWAESVNVKRNGDYMPWCGTDHYDFYHEITIAVSDLPPEWPVLDRAVLDLWAESGNLRASGKEFGLTKGETDSIKRRFDKWQTVTKARAGK